MPQPPFASGRPRWSPSLAVPAGQVLLLLTDRERFVTRLTVQSSQAVPGDWSSRRLTVVPAVSRSARTKRTVHLALSSAAAGSASWLARLGQATVTRRESRP
jgi:hypothetical protein